MGALRPAFRYTSPSTGARAACRCRPGRGRGTGCAWWSRRPTRTGALRRGARPRFCLHPVLPTPRLIVREPALLTGAVLCSEYSGDWVAKYEAGAHAPDRGTWTSERVPPRVFSDPSFIQRQGQIDGGEQPPSEANARFRRLARKHTARASPAPPTAAACPTAVPSAPDRVAGAWCSLTPPSPGATVLAGVARRSASPIAPPAPFRSAHSALLLPERTAAAQTAAAREEQVPAAPDALCQMTE